MVGSVSFFFVRVLDDGDSFFRSVGRSLLKDIHTGVSKGGSLFFGVVKIGKLALFTCNDCARSTQTFSTFPDRVVGVLYHQHFVRPLITRL